LPFSSTTPIFFGQNEINVSRINPGHANVGLSDGNIFLAARRSGQEDVTGLSVFYGYFAFIVDLGFRSGASWITASKSSSHLVCRFASCVPY
jgi:hypothetical protein